MTGRPISEPALAGVALGLVLASTLANLIKSLLFQVRVLEPGVYVAAVLIILSIALLASYLPARRAVAANPIRALKRE